MNRHTFALAIVLTSLTSVALAQFAPLPPWPSLHGFVSSTGKPLDQAGLSPAELKVLRLTLLRLSEGPGCQNEYIHTCGAPASLFLAKVKIRTDGHTAVVVRSQADCGTLGCPYWLVDTSGSGTVLIEEFGWGYRVLPSHSHGYFYVVTAAGNHEVGLGMWGYDGHHYRPVRCATTQVTDDPGPAPPIVDHPCPSDAK